MVYSVGFSLLASVKEMNRVGPHTSCQTSLRTTQAVTDLNRHAADPQTAPRQAATPAGAWKRAPVVAVGLGLGDRSFESLIRGGG